jgi:hypothetical protein
LVNGSVFSPSLIPSQVANLVVAWIDITLIVNDAYLSLIYRFLGHVELRTAASETLANIVSKKMNSVSKLELIAFLNLTQVVESLEADEDVEFSEALSNLVNVQGLELTRILTEVFLFLLFSTDLIQLGCSFVRAWNQSYEVSEGFVSSSFALPFR